ncbi:18576_t:CDS:2 [Acaulospora morrowiae]|uniref:Multiple inositol polyphosphate phosphatase 1 n=1 Tax=Acaulospora morrowiae TaxID=94023 RepID=A0A9N8VQV6_9GLOM|nr:18576_t:CDS:2 [Acaulospora morrowiae]
MLLQVVIFSSLFLYLSISKRFYNFDFTKHLSTKNLYPIESDTAPSADVPESCGLVQLHLVARHGARNPSIDDVKELDVLDTLFANVPIVKDWRNPFSQSQASLLTQRGEHELYLLGKRSRKRHPKFWGNITYNPNVIEFRSSERSRSGQSGIAYSLGLFEGYGKLGESMLQPVYIHTTPASQDKELLTHHICPLWVNTIKYSPAFEKQKKIFLHTYLSKIAERLSNRFGMRPPLKPIHVDYIYRACSYAVSYSGSTDTWCSLLEEDDFLKLEYFHDMEKYYTFSYGSPLNTKLACKLYTSLVKSVDTFLEGKSSLKSVLKFAHAETIIFVTTMLGLYKDDYPLEADRFYQSKSREFRTSNIAPFASNVYFEIYNCTNKYETTIYVQMLVNEKPVVIPGCGYTFCLWDRFKQLLGNNIDCDFDRICQS